MDFFTPEQIEHFASSTVRIDLLAQMEFIDDTVRVWNGTTRLEANGETWMPMHGCGAIDGIGLSTGTTSEAVTMTLSGLPEDATNLLANALQRTPRVNQQVMKTLIQLFDDDWQTVGNPIPVWWGFMQPPEVSRTPMQETEGATQTIGVSAENAFFNRGRPPYGRYTDRDQQRRYPGDKFFQFTPSLLFKTVTYPDY